MIYFVTFKLLRNMGCKIFFRSHTKSYKYTMDTVYTTDTRGKAR